jgi:O-antigen ligase
MVAALVAMTLALVLTFSRAAIVGAAAMTATWGALSMRRVTRRGLLISAGAVVGVGLVLTLTASPGPLLARVQETLVFGTAERGGIWRDAGTAARAYVATGTGLGTFERAMLIYQTSDRRTRTNQAHNQYLQTLTEAGLPLTLLTLVVCGLFARLAQRRLREDSSDGVWLRIGSVAGLVGVATQSLWETGLRMPANGVLLALLAAVAVHRPTQSASAAHRRST